MSSILIKNGNIFDGERFITADLLTKNDKIIKIEKNIGDSADFVYDAAGEYVSAGFVDIHSHILGISSDNLGTPADSSFFPFGVTAGINAGACKGDEKILGTFKMKSGVFVSIGFENERLSFVNTEKMLKSYGNSVFGIKFCFDEKIFSFCNEEHLKQVVDFAESHGLILMVHCSNSPISMVRIVNILRKGDILTHVFHGGTNTCLDDDFAAFKKAKEKGVVMDVGMAGHVHTDFNILKTAVERGFIPNTISTDITKLSAFTRGGKYGMTLCMSVLKECGMSEEEIFKAVTLSPAMVLSKEWGKLQVGGTADIAITTVTDIPFCFNYNNISFSGTKTYDCKLTVCDGLVTYKK